MVRIRRFGVIRTANVAALLYLVLFAIFIIPTVLIVLAIGEPIRGSSGSTPAGLFAVTLLVLLIVYPIFGWIFTAIMCLLYNLVARWTGGIEFEAVTVAPAAPPPTPTPYQPPAGNTGKPGTPEAT